jgi:hypothetical protein
MSREGYSRDSFGLVSVREIGFDFLRFRFTRGPKGRNVHTTVRPTFDHRFFAIK